MFVQHGNCIQLHYTTYSADGGVVETSSHREPLQFVVGSNEIVGGINRAVVGMTKGEKRRIAVAPEQAFGFRDASLLQSTPLLGFMEKVVDGDQLKATIAGTELDVWVRKATDGEITLDANHPLAGESLIYEIEVVGIADGT